MGDMRCGNGTIRTPHPVELFGEDWFVEDAAARPGGPHVSIGSGGAARRTPDDHR